jgi:hypothetical protein
MALKDEIKTAVDLYARGDLEGDLQWHIDFFSFLGDNPDLQRRVGEEYYSARYIYKLLEGLRIDDEWARRAQVQLQVQQYASIYEACLHHLLFTTCHDSEHVTALLQQQGLKPWSVNQELQRRLREVKAPNGRNVVAAIESTFNLEEARVRFDSKAEAATKIGIVDAKLGKELIQFYTARNMIHIHAELKRGADWSWEINFSLKAYRRLLIFKQQVEKWQQRNGDV